MILTLVASIDSRFIPYLIAAMMILFVMFCFGLFYWGLLRHWLRSYRAKLGLSLLEIVSLSAQKLRPAKIIDALIIAQESGFLTEDETLSFRSVAVHERNGGDANRVIHEMREQRRLNKPRQTFSELATLELKSETPFDNVQ